MNKRLMVCETYICRVNLNKACYKPDIENETPRSLCVIDLDNKYAIEVDTSNKYQFIESASLLYLINELNKRIKDGDRVAFAHTIVNVDELPRKTQLRIMNIEKLIYQDFEFDNGNEVLSNEEYFNNKSKQHTKKIGRWNLKK